MSQKRDTDEPSSRQKKISAFFSASSNRPVTRPDDEAANQGASCSDSSATQMPPDNVPTAEERQPCPAGEGSSGSTTKHRLSGWDPSWLENPKYKPWLYKTDIGKFSWLT